MEDVACAARRRRRILQSRILSYFIGNCDFWENKKEHMFIEHMLDKHVFGRDNKTMAGLEDVKTFFPQIIVKRVIFI